MILADAFDKYFNSELPQEFIDEIKGFYQKIGGGAVSVRSSATAEDSADAAWAGQLETYLNTKENNLIENIQKCWASLFSGRAQFYKKEKGFGEKKVSVAVVVQKMVESEKSGIAFSVHPVTQDHNHLVIEAIYGLGEAIVSGKVNPDTYTIAKQEKKICQQKLSADKPVLSEQERLELAGLIMKIEEHYGFPVDVEWAQEKGKFYIIQSRPITTIGKDEEQKTKDISYILGLYSKYRLEMVYFNYPCLVLYACLTWHWLTGQAKQYFGATVPFFLFFIQDRAGALESPWYLGPGECVMGDLEREGLEWVQKNKQQISRAEEKFYSWLKENPVRGEDNLEGQLVLLHKTVNCFLENHLCFQISTQIDKPLNSKIQKVFCNAGSTLSEREIFGLCVSDQKAEVALHEEAIKELRQWSINNQIGLFREDFEINLQNHEFKTRLQACYNIGYFLYSGYGEVNLWSLKDEFYLLADYVEAPASKKKSEGIDIASLNAEEREWVEIARHFSVVRDRRKSFQQRAFYRIAEILEAMGRITGISRTDLECLRIEEFTKEFLTGSAIKSFIKERKAGYVGFWSFEVGTWEWDGVEAVGTYQKLSQKYQSVQTLKGETACPGIARGKVRVITKIGLDAPFKEGEVLVTGMTSPDFVPLMKKAAAVITELGGITCHAAIISRELHIPCVIGTNIATKVLRDGDFVEVDANLGLVRVLDKS